MVESITLEREIEQGVEEIFKRNGEKLTEERKRWYSEWPSGEVGSKIKSEVNALIKTFKSKAETETYRDTVSIGKIEINGQEVELSLVLGLYNQISSINDSYFSLYETSYENVDKHICNPTYCSVNFETGDIAYTNEEVAYIGDIPITREEIQTAMDSMEGIDDEVVELDGIEFDLADLEELLQDCDNPEIYETYYESQSYKLDEVINLLKEGQVVINSNLGVKELIGHLELLKEYANNTRLMTKEQEEFLEKYKLSFKDYSDKIKDEENHRHFNYFDVVEKFIGEYNKKVNNSEKVDISLSRPGFKLIKEITPKIRGKIINNYEILKDKVMGVKELESKKNPTP